MRHLNNITIVVHATVNVFNPLLFKGVHKATAQCSFDPKQSHANLMEGVIGTANILAHEPKWKFISVDSIRNNVMSVLI